MCPNNTLVRVPCLQRNMRHGLEKPFPSPPSIRHDGDVASDTTPTPKPTCCSEFKDSSMSSSPISTTGPTLESVWLDETRGFNMATVCATLRNSNEQPGELVKSYNWYPNAVPVDGLLPPGVALSAKEICIYYPHHVRWQDVMLRLSRNDYRGSDIIGIQTLFRGDPRDHMSSPAMNQIQRDSVQRLLPAFKTAGYKGEGDSDIHTDRLKPGPYLEKKFKGFVIPTFDDLLQGLMALPQGEDTRGFTQCLAWYLNVHLKFTPKLDLNILHAQALIRALKIPPEPAVSPNLNRLALKQWREQGRLPKTDCTAAIEAIDGEDNGMHLSLRSSRTRAVFNIHGDPADLKMQVDVPIRHILTFPFLSLHSVIAKALEMGIDRAEHRRAMRKGMVVPVKVTAKVKAIQESPSQHTPKRRRYDSCGAGMSSVQNLPSKKPRIQETGNGHREMPMPKRPTVSPITPRTSSRHPVSKQAAGQFFDGR